MGQLHRLKIEAFKDERFTQHVDEPCTFTLQVNPETYRRGHRTSYMAGKSASRFNGMEPQTLSFGFYLDGTGVIGGVPSVKAAIDAFKRLVYDYNGDIHSPNYLLLTWGGLDFRCRLTSLDIEYTLFKPDGTPLRAKLDAAFQEHLARDTIARSLHKNPPGLTQLRTVEPGDTLPLMCERIYGDSRFYIQVARHNGLSHFRWLEPGTCLSFPPLEQMQ